MEYELQRNGDGTWSVIEADTRRPITFQGRLQISLTEDAARDTLSALNQIEKER